MKHPTFFDKKTLQELNNHTPFFVFSRKALLSNLKEYKNCLPQNTEICYAMKANSEKIVLQILNNLGVSFELASKYELTMLKAIRVPAKRIIFGASVKSEDHLKAFVKYGVDRFAFDSELELLKIARCAPKSHVYIRVHVNDKSHSVFNMSEKFGITSSEAISLLLKARGLGLVPYGISFNVGSQAKNARAWARGIRDVAQIMKKLQKYGIKISMINLGGGFPHNYRVGDGFPHIKEISQHINVSIKKLPYSVRYIAEPGRGLVANTFILISTVIGKSKRNNSDWLFLDAGVYNALPESMTCQGRTRYHVGILSGAHYSRKKEHFTLTGPTCDNIDVSHRKELLPIDIKVGDKLLIHDVGAYTFPLISRFNGFPKPKVIQQ